jgi:hypothetical protein
MHASFDSYAAAVAAIPAFVAEERAEMATVPA